MRYFHCPKLYRGKQYGCGFGPVNGTQAFLDLSNQCPKCKQALKPHRESESQKKFERDSFEDAVDFVENQFGQDAADRYRAEKGKKQ